MNKRGFLKVSGMNCANCAMGIEQHLKKHGIHNPEVNFATEEVRFDITDAQTRQKVMKLIDSLGYKYDSGEGKSQSFSFSLNITQKFFISLTFTLPLLLSMFLPWALLHDMYFQLILTLPVYTIGFFHFGLSAYKSLRARYANMDVLIFTGSSAAFIYSLIGTLGHMGHDYMFYETAASIITIVLFGNLIEQRSVKKTTSAIDELLKLQPEKALRIISDIHSGSESIEEVKATDIDMGDAILVNEGDKVPTDGIIYWGKASVDESMLTGESIPVFKQKDDKVIAGSIVAQGNIKIKTSAIGEDTVLSKIIELVKNAQSQKPRLQNLADKISNIFVPIVVGVALSTFVLSFFGLGIELKAAIMRGIAVLVVACPCALGLAIPTAVVVGVGGMAKKGILIKGGITIDRFAKVKTVVFDKTGTLTTGRFRIKKIHAQPSQKAYIESILLGLEKYATHPIAKSIVKDLTAARVKPMVFNKTEVIKGVGMVGWDNDNNKFEVGSVLMVNGTTDKNTHNIYVLKNRQVIGAVDIEDDIKADAKPLIDFLKSRNIKPIMLSGDSKKNCMDVAKKLGIDKVYYERMPEEKLKIIKMLDAREPTAMVGDGINDAPALAQAGVGISLSNATHVAVESAQIILLNGHLSLLKTAFNHSKKTLLTIKQNLFWAFFYNVLAIPFAAAGYLTPLIAALAMAFSDIIVVLNSLRLKIRLK